jgi:hypothetical protein
MTEKPRWDIRVGEGTGQCCELTVRVLVGSDACKVIVEHERGGPAQVMVAQHDQAGRIAGETVRHMVEQAVVGFLANR